MKSDKLLTFLAKHGYSLQAETAMVGLRVSNFYRRLMEKLVASTYGVEVSRLIATFRQLRPRVGMHNAMQKDAPDATSMLASFSRGR